MFDRTNSYKIQKLVMCVDEIHLVKMYKKNVLRSKYYQKYKIIIMIILKNILNNIDVFYFKKYKIYNFLS